MSLEKYEEWFILPKDVSILKFHFISEMESFPEHSPEMSCCNDVSLTFHFQSIFKYPFCLSEVCYV